MKNSIYVTDQAGNLIDLSELYDRVAKLERSTPILNLPKQKRRSRSEKDKILNRAFKSSLK